MRLVLLPLAAFAVTACTPVVSGTPAPVFSTTMTAGENSRSVTPRLIAA